ncbi:CIR protein [Plasmodium chabaudi adami]|uniref:CIR protein n=1 Tax=Plasmodium chabaudi adami TaxID=5826 RepID=A0A1C6WN98_PLACE|nr:CIR protein [Plasmodium chabaudi adami]
MANKACSFLLEADEYFNNGIVDVDKFNKNTSLEYRCPYENRTLRPCQNNYERINALGAYLYQNLSTTSSSLNGTGHNNNRHVEFFLIWLGDKLFKIDKDYKITMGEYYEKNLKNSMGNFNYWNVLKSKAVYKDATIRRMNQMYSLLNNICKLITEYNKHNKNPKNITSSDRDILVNHSTQCRNFYGSIHKSVNGCKPYLHLLDSLKKLYENFLSARIIKNKSLDKATKNSLSTRIKSLKTFGDEDKYFISDKEELRFDTEECGKVKIEDEDLGKKIASKGSPSKTQDNGKPKGTITGDQTKQPVNPRGTNDQSGKSPITGKPSLGSQPQSAAAKPTITNLPPAKPAPAKPNPPRPQPAAPGSASGPSGNVKQVSGDSPAKKPVHTPPGPVQGQAQIPRKPDPTKPGAIIPGTPPPPQLGGTPPAKSPPAPPQGSQKLGTIPPSGAKGSDKGSDASKSDTTGSGIQKGNSDSGGGGKGALSADTGGTSGGSKNKGGKPIDDTQKKAGHVDTSPPVSQASSQGMGSGNQRGAGGASPSSIDSGKGNTTDNTSTGDNGKKDPKGVTVSKGTTANNKGDQHQGTDHTQGSSSSVTGGSAIGPGVGKGGSPGGSGGSGKAQGSLSGGPGNPGGDPGVTSSGASGGKVDGADSGASTGSVSAQSDQGVPPGGSVPPGNGQGDTSRVQGVGKAGKDGQVGDNSNIQGGVGVNKGGADSNTGVSGVGKGTSISGTGGGSNSQVSTSVGKGDSISEKGSPDSGQGGSPGGAGGSDSKVGSEKGGGGVNTGDSGGGTGSTSSGPGSGTDGTDGGLGTPNAVSLPGDPNSVSITSGDGTKASGKSSGSWFNFLGVDLNPMSHLPSISNIYQTPKDILTNTANHISNTYSNTVSIVKDAYGNTVDIAKNAYGSTVDIARNAYGSAVTNIKSALTTSSNYIGNAVGSVTSKLNPFSSSSQPSGDQSGSNSLGGGVDTSDQSQQNPSLPSPSPPSQTSQPISPPKTPSDPPSAPSPKLLDPQPISTQIPKSSDQQSTPSTGKGVSQIPLSTKGTLPSSSISPSNTGNGNNPPGTDVKINEKPSIWCIAQNKKCDILGIGIIGTSLFVFLAIMYKYISFGSAKNSKKEKNMKRVINLVGGKKRERTFINSGDDKKMMKIIINSDDKKKSIKQEIYSHDGKRKTHITINSGYKKKNTKSVINSDDRKKTKIIVNSVNEKIPLLNIYKLMQANPMPFINLFFLLIFFVYKRKRDTIE